MQILKQKNKIDMGCVFLFFLSSIIFLLIFSPSTSPLFPSYYAGDSSIFQAVGYLLKEFNAVPYIDTFDHKGPLIFFINALGSLFSVRTGLFCIQIVFLTISIYGFYLIAKIKFSSINSVLIAMLTLIYYATWCGNGGNTVEEYNLPFIVFSLYLNLKYFLGESKDHKPVNAFFYGIGFAFCTMMRITDSLIICIGVFTITVTLIYKKLWKNLMRNILGFLMGCLLVFVPVSVYFLANGAFCEFLYGTFLFNIEYATKMNNLVDYSVREYIRVIVKMLPAYFLAFAALLGGRHYILRKAPFLLMALAHIIWMFKSNIVYQHYQIVSLGFIAIALVLVKESYDNYSDKKRIQNYLKCCCGAFALGALMISGNTFLSQVKWIKDKTYAKSVEQVQRLEQFVKENVPKEELNLLAGYNIGAAFYIEAEIKPFYCYFILVDGQMEFSNSLKAKVYEAYESCGAKYVLAQGIRDEHIKEILAENYFIAATMQSKEIILYQRK